MTAKPLAILAGEPITDAPRDLFIPPGALQIILTDFAGPLDLLLYLIRRQNLDIRNIPVLKITEQYLAYIRDIEHVDFALAADYLLMAGVLVALKARVLLPELRAIDAEEEEDPKAELSRRLLVYEEIKNAGHYLAAKLRAGRDFMWFSFPRGDTVSGPRDLPGAEVLRALWQELKTRKKEPRAHHVPRESWSVARQSRLLLSRIGLTGALSFGELRAEVGSDPEGLVVTFIALLELVKAAKIRVRQKTARGDIMLYAAGFKEEKAEK